MRPVRVTSPGASPVLPLRMVAGGTGAVTPITLWVIAEGRYETTNMQTFTVDPAEVVWNWDSKSSNYATIKKLRFDQSEGKAWLAESSDEISRFALSDPLESVVYSDPDASGYGDAMGQGAAQELDDDMDALYGSISSTSIWVTRLHAQLSRAALATDLQLGASSDQSPIERNIVASKTAGTAPACPSFPPCDSNSNSNSNSDGAEAGGGGCAMTNTGSGTAMLSGVLLAAALTLSRVRRRRI